MISVCPFTDEWIRPVREFNHRLHSSEFTFPEQPSPEYFLAVEDGTVRGGYILRRQRFSIHGHLREVAHYRLPLSEGVINRAYAGVGALLLRHALRQQPLLYALGMGGFNRPLPRMLQAAGWTLHAVPFHFRPIHTARVLWNMRHLWKTAGVSRRLAGYRPRLPGRPAAVAPAEVVPSFGPWAGEVWDKSREHYPALALRDERTLGELYPPRERFHRLKFGQDGWAVVLDTRMRGDRYFGNLRVGSIVDCLAPPGHAPVVLRSATRFLQDRGVDLIVSNQSHAAWSQALLESGLRQGPSNFIFAASQKLAELAPDPAKIHINRGDGDGPIHL